MLKKIAFALAGFTLLASPLVVLADTSVPLSGLSADITTCLTPPAGTTPDQIQTACTNLIQALLLIVSQIHIHQPQPQPHPSPITVITSPTGQSFNAGDTMNIQWSDPTASTSTRYYILLWAYPYPTGGAGWQVSPPDQNGNAGNLQGTSFSWIVTSQPTPGQYQIRVCRLGEDVCGISGALTVGAPSVGIQVTAPNGGEQWEEGVLNSITWTPYGYNPDINPSRDVNAYLETKNPDGSFNTIGSVIPSGKASIHWITGFRNDGLNEGMIDPGSGYYIRVVNTKTGAWDRSDAPFTILPQSIKLQVNGSHGPVSVSSAYQTVNLSWSASPKLTGCYLGGSISAPNGTQMYVPNTGTATVAVNLSGQPQGSISLNCTQAPLQDNDPNPTLPPYTTQISDTVSILLNGVPQPQPMLQITSPNGGEQLDTTQTQTIRWHMTGAQVVSIALYKNDMWYGWITKQKYIGTSPDGNYSFGWQPNLPINYGDSSGYTPPNPGDGAVYKIYITAQKSDGTGYIDDKSDAPFSFVTAPTPNPINNACPVNYLNNGACTLNHLLGIHFLNGLNATFFSFVRPGLNYVINFGDGTEQSVTTCTLPLSGQSSSCTDAGYITHAYAKSGTYQVSVIDYTCTGGSTACNLIIDSTSVVVTGTAQPQANSAPLTNPNLASALSALEASLKVFLGK
jgi:hypothetical protein